ncbi:hypothetical protein LXL04_020166 [Taraxacum kok-saghyz]
MLKASSWNGIVRFQNDGKFSPCFLGPFTVLERVGSEAYKLELPLDMHDINDTFDVEYLFKYVEKQNVIHLSDTIHTDDISRYIKEPEVILDTKVQWRNLRGVDVTWESKEDMQTRYPWLFA